MPGISNIQEFVNVLNSIGKDKFMVKETKVGSNLSLGDLKDEWMTLKKYGWKWYTKTIPGEFLNYYVFEKIADKATVQESIKEDFDINQLSFKDRYSLLDRMRSDCEYYLGYGNKNPKHLWSGDPKKQIEDMKILYNSLEEKPEWLTMEDINNYDMQMNESINEAYDEHDVISNVDDLESILRQAVDICYSLISKLEENNPDAAYITNIILDNIENLIVSKFGDSYDLDSIRDFIKPNSSEIEESIDCSKLNESENIEDYFTEDDLEEFANAVVYILNQKSKSTYHYDYNNVEMDNNEIKISIVDDNNNEIEVSKLIDMEEINLPSDLIERYVDEFAAEAHAEFTDLYYRKRYEDKTNESVVNEASYGGAYDIEDDQYFTKDDLMEFAEAVIEDLSERTDGEFDYNEVYMNENNKLQLGLIDNFGNEITIEKIIDMRKIRLPKDLLKYKDEIVAKALNDFNNLYDNEN